LERCAIPFLFYSLDLTAVYLRFAAAYIPESRLKLRIRCLHRYATLPIESWKSETWKQVTGVLKLTGAAPNESELACDALQRHMRLHHVWPSIPGRATSKFPARRSKRQNGNHEHISHIPRGRKRGIIGVFFWLSCYFCVGMPESFILYLVTGEY
jgi:hypothetical protein